MKCKHIMSVWNVVIENSTVLVDLCKVSVKVHNLIIIDVSSVNVILKTRWNAFNAIVILCMVKCNCAWSLK